MEINTDRDICMQVFKGFMQSVKSFNADNGFNNLGPCLILIGEKNNTFIPPEVLIEEDLVSLINNIPMISKNIGNIIGLCAGVHVTYGIPTPFVFSGNMIFETEDFYSVMNIMLDRNGGAPKERTLVVNYDGDVHHIDKMAFQEPFQDELRKMKAIANCISSFNLGLHMASSM